MADTNNSTNMALPVPVVGTDPGPDYAYDLNSCLTLIDQHDHSPGFGVQITPSGMNINADLVINSHNLTLIRSARYAAQGSPLALAADLNCSYVSGVDLYYNDGNGNQVRLTQGGSVAGSTGSISGLSSPASASYVALSATFVWQSAANTPASLDAGSIILRNITANSNGITMNPPNALASNYSLTWMAALPGSTSFMGIDTSGNISAYASVSGGLTGTNLAAATITSTQIAANGIAYSNLPVANTASSSASGGFTTSSTSFVQPTNLSRSITTSGRPVLVMVQPDGVSSSCGFEVDGAGSVAIGYVSVSRGASVLGISTISSSVTGSPSITVPPSSIIAFDTPASGTYTYTIKIRVDNAAYTMAANNMRLVVMEL